MDSTHSPAPVAPGRRAARAHAAPISRAPVSRWVVARWVVARLAAGLWARPVFSQEAVCGGFCLSWPVTPGREGQVCTGAPVAHWLRPGCCHPQTLHRPRPQRSQGGLADSGSGPGGLPESERLSPQSPRAPALGFSPGPRASVLASGSRAGWGEQHLHAPRRPVGSPRALRCPRGKALGRMRLRSGRGTVGLCYLSRSRSAGLTELMSLSLPTRRRRAPSVPWGSGAGDPAAGCRSAGGSASTPVSVAPPRGGGSSSPVPVRTFSTPGAPPLRPPGPGSPLSVGPCRLLGTRRVEVAGSFPAGAARGPLGRTLADTRPPWGGEPLLVCALYSALTSFYSSGFGGLIHYFPLS